MSGSEGLVRWMLEEDGREVWGFGPNDHPGSSRSADVRPRWTIHRTEGGLCVTRNDYNSWSGGQSVTIPWEMLDLMGKIRSGEDIPDYAVES